MMAVPIMLLLDGPMGTELARRGIVIDDTPAWSALALERAPETVRAIHSEYVSAGAEVHRANTFRTQPDALATTSVPHQDWRALLDLALLLARKAGATRVAGSMAPIADCYRPDLAPPPSVARARHRTIAAAMAGGVDLIVCETFPSGVEAAIATAEAARTGKETWVALTAGPDASLMTPAALEEAARACVGEGARAVLVSCTAAIETHRYVERLAHVGVPFGAYANAGAPSAGLGWDADASRAGERYALLAERWVSLGATIVGACCGCGPAHIRALRERFA